MCAFAAICTGSANAADLPFKAPPPPPPVFSWTGLYVGGNVGGSIGMNSNTQSTTFSSTALGVNGLLTGSTGSLALAGVALDRPRH
jgi:outer membrane immunogenic protein